MKALLPEPKYSEGEQIKKEYYDILDICRKATREAREKREKNFKFKSGEFVKLCVAINDGYTPEGSYNNIFIPPIIVKVLGTEGREYEYKAYKIKVLEKHEIPKKYIDTCHFNPSFVRRDFQILYEPESYLERIELG